MQFATTHLVCRGAGPSPACPTSVACCDTNDVILPMRHAVMRLETPVKMSIVENFDDVMVVWSFLEISIVIWIWYCLCLLHYRFEPSHKLYSRPLNTAALGTVLLCWENGCKGNCIIRKKPKKPISDFNFSSSGG